jgi:periplasmic protein CpxP/Spy
MNVSVGYFKHRIRRTRMIKSRTLVAIATVATAALIAGSALAHDDGSPGRRHRPDAGKFLAHMEKNRARLHDKLKLAPEQEAAWKVFAEKTKPQAPRIKAVRSELAALPAPARMDRMIALMKERESRMVDRAAAVKEFYAVLTPEQQKLFDEQTARRLRKR